MIPASFWKKHIRKVLLRRLSAQREFLLDRILPSMSNAVIAAEANAIADSTRTAYEQDAAGQQRGASAEAAKEAGLAHYEEMTAIRQGVLNLFAVAIRHTVEQQQATILRWELPRKDRRKPLDSPREFDRRLREWGIDPDTLPSQGKLEELRLVANAVKHAEGGSLKDLRRLKPDLGSMPFEDDAELRLLGSIGAVDQPLLGDGLYVREQDLVDYFNAAAAYWTAIADSLDKRASTDP